MLHVVQDNSHPYDSRIERYQVNDTVKDYKHTNRGYLFARGLCIPAVELQQSRKPAPPSWSL